MEALFADRADIPSGLIVPRAAIGIRSPVSQSGGLEETS
jgi:hypothetical protein